MGKELSNKNHVVEAIVCRQFKAQLGRSALVEVRVLRGPATMGLIINTEININLWDGYLIERDNEALKALLDVHFEDKPSLLIKDVEPLWQGCFVPPSGWWCSREAGHEPPCAARPGNYPTYQGENNDDPSN